MKKLFALLIAATTIFSPTGVHAQTIPSVALTVSPPHFEIMLKPGVSKVKAFDIQNTGNTDLIVTPTLIDFTANPVTGEQRLLNTSTFPYAQLNNLDKKLGDPFTLQAGQKDQLVVKFTIPEDAPDHDYYQTLLLSTRPLDQSNPNNTGSQAFATVGINILARISQNGSDAGEIVVDRVKIPKIIDVFSPINMQIFVKNVGKNYTTVKGEVHISSAVTKKVEKVFPILEENVLVNSARQIHAAIPDPDDNKSATASELKYDPLFLIGPYTVEVALGSDKATAKHYEGRVWALPISPLIVIVLFLVARQFLKKLNKKNELKHLDA